MLLNAGIEGGVIVRDGVEVLVHQLHHVGAVGVGCLVDDYAK